jgi:hypothetical protein
MAHRQAAGMAGAAQHSVAIRGIDFQFVDESILAWLSRERFSLPK